MSEPTSERDAARNHRLWDMRVFRAAVEGWLDPTQRERLPYGDCICVDSLLIHARSLYHFFSNNRQRPKDFIAGDLVVPVDGSPWAAKFSFLDTDVVGEISAFRGHLTGNRNDLERTDWSRSDIEAIRADIDRAWGDFIAQIPEPERGDWQV